MPLLFLALLAAWFATLPGVRAIGAALLGRPVPARPARPPGGLGRWGPLIAVAALLCGLAAPIPALLRGRSSTKPGTARITAGVVLFLAGTGGTLLTQRAMGASWRPNVTPGERTALVTDGPFRIVRNPMYTSRAISVLGLVLVLPNPLSVTMLVLVVVAWQIQVRLVEEPYLRATHPEHYALYAQKVGRFVPLLGRDTPRPRAATPGRRLRTPGRPRAGMLGS